MKYVKNKKEFSIRDANTNKVLLKLNSALVEQRKLSTANVIEILDLHAERLSLLEDMASCDPTKSAEKLVLRRLAEEHREIQFKLQEAWGFEKNQHYHDWFEVPHCTCPKEDNRERKGTCYQVINLTCPIHGNL